MDLTPDGSLRLSVTAAARAGRQVWVFGGSIAFVAAVAMLPIVTGDGIDSPLDLVMLAAPLVVFLVLLAVFSLRLLRRPKQWPLVVGADRETRVAVRRAVRVGYSAD